jgi:hypothetical protein
MATELSTPARTRRTLLGGKIILNGNCSIFDCTVIALGEETATLKTENARFVPNVFTMKIPSYNEDYICEVQKRSGIELQVSFRINPRTGAGRVLKLVRP